MRSGKATIAVVDDPRPGDPISVRDAYLAMRNFLYRYWEEGKRADDGLRQVLSDSSLRIWRQDADEPRTADPAFWHNWKHAVRDALSGIQPEDLMDRPETTPPAR
jgi:hypothetical protein